LVTAGTDVKGRNLRCSLSKGESLKTSFIESWEQWIKGRAEIYQQFRDASGHDWPRVTYDGPSLQSYYVQLPNGTFRTMTMKEFQDAVPRAAPDCAREKNQLARRHRKKTTRPPHVSYQFREGMFKGLRTGGTFRWRSAPMIGFPVSEPFRRAPAPSRETAPRRRRCAEVPN
jgi:hypothetical protein